MKPKWILLAEDDDNDADLSLRALRQSTHNGEVLIAHDGSQALDCLYRRNSFQSREDSNPALVILDLKMPKVDGWEVLHRIKSDTRLKMIPVVMFTSSQEDTDLLRCYLEGANAYVVKPLDFKEFVATMQGLHSFWMSLNQPPPDRSCALITETATGRQEGSMAA